MQRNRTAIVGAAILWLGTLAGAYYLGNHVGTARDGTAAPGAAGSARENASQGASAEGRGPRNRETAVKPPTVKQIFGKVKSAMRGGVMLNPAAGMKVMGLLDKIQSADLPEAIAEMEAITDPQQKMMLSMCLLAKWAELDGPAAMKYAEEHSAGLGPMGQMSKVGVLSAWAENDPEAAWKWYQNQPEKTSGGLMGGNLVLTTLFAKMAENDPDQAFQRLTEIKGASNRQMALSGMFQSAVFDDAKRQQMLTNIGTMPDEVERKQAKQTMLGQWAMMAPEEAVAWVGTQPPEEQKDLRQSMGTMLMMSDPKTGAKCMLEGVTEEEKPASYDRIVSHWASMDTSAAGDWLKQQPQGPQLDQARQTLVNRSSQSDPSSAMEWAASITNPDLRVSATTTAYQTWKQKDAAAADQALSKSGLDAAQIQAIKEGGNPSP